MSEINQFFKGFDFKSDFVALSYREWQLEEAKEEAIQVSSALKKKKAFKQKQVYFQHYLYQVKAGLLID